MNAKHCKRHWKIGESYALIAVAIIMFAVSTRSVFADQTNQELKIDAVKTKIIDGFYIGLLGVDSYSTNNTTLDERLLVFTWTTNTPAWITIPVELEYAYRVELLDTNGVAMPKTKLGKRVGAKFFEFDTAPSKKGIAARQIRVEKIGETAGGPLLFYPYRTRDLFKIDRPGSYTLQISFQILTFPRTGPNRKDYTNNLIRFPPLNYPLVQPDSTPKKGTNDIPK